MIEVEATSNLGWPDGRPVQFANTTTVATGEIARDPQVQKLVREVSSWMEKARYGEGVRRGGNGPSMFDRQLYLPPDNPYEQMRVARIAVAEDDIVSGVAEATEALAFDGGLKWESSEPDEADVLNQLSADLNLDGVIRAMWRELFTCDQFIMSKMWDSATYTVRGQTDNGNARKKRVDLWAPTQLSILDPMRIVPIGYGPLRQDQLAWQATLTEIDDWRANTENMVPVDPLMSTFFTGPYTCTPEEAVQLSSWGVDSERLLRVNPDWVFRHTATRPDYRKFPELRLRGVFAQLDLKRQLMASDRAMLIGAANYILLIRKGTDDKPATQDEVNNLKAGYNFLAKLPVIISDHRLEIDIIAPKLDFVLKKEAYDVLDHRILSGCLSTFVSTGTARGAGTADTFSDALAAGLQNRRHMLKRTIEKEIGRAIVEHPRNAGKFTTRPSLVFTPRTVSIGRDNNVLQALLTLRTQREISRDTMLEYLGLDEATEAQRLEVEERIFDPIFKTQIPFAASNTQTGQPQTTTDTPAAPTKTNAPATKPSTPNGTPEAPGVSGARGGRPRGGGTSTQSPASTAKPRSSNGNPQTPRS